MFAKFLRKLTSDETIDKAYRRLGEMLERASAMFDCANSVIHGKPAAEIEAQLYDHEHAINNLERSIRRKLMRHLTVNQGYDTGLCLAMLSTAKDAERIGDYCHNVFEIGRLYTDGLTDSAHQQAAHDLAERNRELFGLVIRACRQSDESATNAAIERARDIDARCVEFTRRLQESASAEAFHERVAYALLAQHYRRVAHHLSHIALAIMGRLDDLDFYPESESEARKAR